MSGPGWTDLATLSTADRVDTDICIVGAGAAGIYLATELSRRGVATVVVEAGGEPAASGDQLGFEPSFGLDPYPGALVGRAFGMGGSTSRWGGALVPHTSYDLRAGGMHEAAWRTIVDRVGDNARAVLSPLGYEVEPDFERYPEACHPSVVPALARAGIAVHANLMLPARRKNLSFLWRYASVHHPPRVPECHGEVMDSDTRAGRSRRRHRTASRIPDGQQGFGYGTPFRDRCRSHRVRPDPTRGRSDIQRTAF